jgi:hypothetical protein
LRLKAKNIAKILRLLKYGSEEKGSSTFWQVRCCAQRTRRSSQKYDEAFFKFCGLLRKPKTAYANHWLKPNYFKKQCSSISFLLTCWVLQASLDLYR